MFKAVMTRMGYAFATTMALSAAVKAETLADALAYGYENSGLLEQQRATLRASDEGVAQSVASLRPTLDWASTITAQEPMIPGGDEVTGSLRLSASLLLWDGGRTNLTIENKREGVMAARYALVAAEQQIMMRIVSAYMNVRRALQFVELRQNNVDLIARQLRASRDRFELGEVTSTDVAQTEARLAAARSQLAADQGTLAQAQAEYIAAVGRAPVGALAAAPSVAIRQSLAEAQSIAMGTHPTIKQAQHTVSAWEIAVSAQETATMPTVRLGANVSTPLFDNFGEVTESLSLNIGGPIYSGGLYDSMARQAMSQRDAARSALLVATQNVAQGVANAYANLEVARASSQALTEQVRAATIAFDGVREEADLGARTTLDVLNAEQELLNARANLISSQISETVASYNVLAAMGLLTAAHLQLNVQIYDPAAYYNMVESAPSALSQQGRDLNRILEALGAE